MRDRIYPHAIRNAAQYGKADPRAVMSKVLGENPELREKAAETLRVVEEIVSRVNKLTPEELEKESERFIEEKGEHPEKRLEPLKGAEEGKVRLRFAPNPSGPLHLGHSRAAVINDSYARMYRGELILRFEDTDPRRVDPDAYDMIRGDLKWLDVEIHREILQSERLELYYEHARKLLEKKAVYVCKCAPEEFKRMRESSRPCPCREDSGLEEFEKMHTGYGEGEAVMRLKTDLKHTNVSFRDYPIMRIVDTPHPIAGDKKVYPLMNFSVAVDDHHLGLTHVLRGKDHILNTHKQAIIYNIFDWKPPEYLHYGLLKIEGVNLSTSEIKEGIEAGSYSGWDDVRLGTIAALKRRGIQKDAIRGAMMDVGVKQTDISFSWKNLYAANKELIDPLANRYSFVESPSELRVRGAPEKEAKNRLHPTIDRGYRTTDLKEGDLTFLIGKRDFERIKEGEVIRLMGAYNVEITKKHEDLEARYHSSGLEDAREKKAPLINWIRKDDSLVVSVISIEGTYMGLGEKALKDTEVGEIIQFERFGFARIDRKNRGVVAVYAHS